MAARLSLKKLCVRAGVSVALLGLVSVLCYVSFGHSIIRLIYESRLPMLERVMEAKATIPIDLYYDAADKLVLNLGIWCIAGGMVFALFAKDPLGLVFSGISLTFASLAVFFLLDLVPALVKPLHFDMIPYFNFRLTYVPDAVLGFREKPFRHDEMGNFRGYGYSPVYGIDVSPEKMVWDTDSEGFRNLPGASSTDIAVIGSSFVEYGNSLESTYGKQLEKLSGYSVLNLGKAGYGPLQYAEVLRRYVVTKKPRYVIFTVYPTVDIEAHVVDWIKGKPDASFERRRIAFDGFFAGYSAAVRQTWQMISAAFSTNLQMWFRNTVGTNAVQRDVAVLRLPHGETKKAVFMDLHSDKTVDERLASREWTAWKTLLGEWKSIIEQHGSIPIILFVPTASEVYSEYSTKESGEEWLKVRDRLVETSGSNEEAVRRVAAEFGIEMISLRPAFQEAARQGKLVYYELDAHWNGEGRAIAARVTAAALNNLHPTPGKPAPPQPTEVTGLSNQSVIERSMNGMIKFWNNGAEKLYGWKKEQALGKITHSLLRTQFPEPLARINHKLSSDGRWEGQLVHTTEDGHKVIVFSRWILDRNSDSEVVIEINTQAGKL